MDAFFRIIVLILLSYPGSLIVWLLSGRKKTVRQVRDEGSPYFHAVITCIVISAIVIMTRGIGRDKSEVFFKNEDQFRRVASIRDSVMRYSFGCCSYRVTLTAKSFWQECDSVLPNSIIARSFFSKVDSSFLLRFMSECGLRYIKMEKGKIEYIFSGYDPDIIVRIDAKQNIPNGIMLDSCFYFIPFKR